MNVENRKTAKGAFMIWGILVLTILLIAILIIKGKPIKETTQSEEPGPAVLVETVHPTTMPDTIQLPGRIQPVIEADLSTEKPGRVSQLPIDKGDHVEAEQLLLQLDDSLWQVALTQAQIEQRDAERELRRREGLQQAGAISTSAFDNIRTRKERADASVTEALEHIDQCKLRAPVAGVIDDRYVELGEFVHDGTILFKLITLDPVKLTLDIPEKEIISVETGQTMAFTVAALQNISFTGTVSFVSSLADRASNAYRAELLVANPSRILVPGMLADVTLVRGIHTNAVILDLETIIPRKGEHIVFIVEGDHAVRRVVSIDKLIGHKALLSDGLRAGEQVVTAGHRGLIDGMRIEITHDKDDSQL